MPDNPELRLAEAQREIQAIANALMVTRSSKRADRQVYAGRLNAVCASLRTVEYALREETP